MLSERYNHDTLAQTLLPREQYHPYPIYAERSAWEAVSAHVRAAHIAATERFLGQEWPTLPATVFMEFQREGNRIRYETLHFARRHALISLVLAECLEGQGRFLDDITNGIWQICEESFWGVPAHNWSRKHTGAALPDTGDPYVDLFASETAALLAWTHYLLKTPLDLVSPLIAERIVRETQARILHPFLTRNDLWWLGLDPSDPDRRMNNWNPWCNGNVLCATLLLETDAARRTATVEKVIRSLDRFLDAYHADGGCDEGPSYWGRAGGSLFDCLELLYGATNGAIQVYDAPLVQNIGRYLYRVYISGSYFVNFADGGAKVNPPGDLVYRYGCRIGDTRLQALGNQTRSRAADITRNGSSPEPLLRALPQLFGDAVMPEADTTPLVRDVWMDGIEVMAAREQADSDAGFYVAAKGGDNAESHNHNDVGQFIVFRDGKPILIDIGVETYSARTFNAHRYEIWTMQSAYHNLPTVGGIQQQPGPDFAARDAVYASDDGYAQLTEEIGAAYPAEAGITTWQRTVRLHRPGKGAAGNVTLRDRFRLNAPREITLTLMTPCTPNTDEPGVLKLTGDDGAAEIQYPADALTATAERIAIDDARLKIAWGDHVYRVLLTTVEPVTVGDWTVTVR